MTPGFWIRYPSEPKELLLAWQAPPSVADRLRWAVGRLRRTQKGSVFDYLEEEEFARLNNGRPMDGLKSAGYSGYPAFDIERQPDGGFQECALEAFLRRIPPSTRTDFPAYLAHYHIEPSTPLSPFALLAATEARLPSDGFSLIDPLDPSADHIDVVVEIAGFRHLPRPHLTVATGTRLELSWEASNPKDPYAVQVIASGVQIGYVNRLQSATVSEWLGQRAIECWVARLNGKPELPRAYAFLQVRPVNYAAAA